MNYRVLLADEVIADIFGLVQYIYTELCNSDAAEKLYYNLNREVKNMGEFPLKFSDSGISIVDISYIKRFMSPICFFILIINSEKQGVYILRVIKDLMNWKKILNRTKIYHFSSYNE